jgi:hypothetical protein
VWFETFDIEVGEADVTFYDGSVEQILGSFTGIKFLHSK